VISAPEDYGLSEAETLSHTVSGKPPRGFDAYWHETREAIESMPVSFRGTIDGPINEVVFESWRAVRIVGRLMLPEHHATGSLRGAVITTHGYEADDGFPDEQEPWTDSGLATLRLRIRGYPPSTLDVPDLRDDWILHGIESPETWIVRGAVVDLMQAYRCLRRRVGPACPISLHGESFGGGLAVIAAAQLAAMGDPPARLAIALPSFGDWRWRRERYCNGAGGQINAMLKAMRADADRIMQTLLYGDACFHARKITIPTLCKLALRDDVVPAPAAAAVFNALQSPVKARLVTPFGHFDGGLANARQHLAFERAHPLFLDPDRPPEDIVHDTVGIDLSPNAPCNPATGGGNF